MAPDSFFNRQLKLYPNLTTGEINITEHSQYNNVKAEKLIIHEHIVARVFGTVNDITLKNKSRIHIHGKVTGNVVNEGGTLEVFAPPET